MRWGRCVSNLRRLWPLGLAMTLGACNPGPDTDLMAYVEQVKSAQRAPMDAPPPRKPEIFRYRADSEGVRDPFEGVVSAIIPQSNKGSGVQPDSRRRRQPLERYPLESLSLVGAVMSSEQRVALVRSGDGVTHQVRIGDYLGQNDGKVIAVDAKEVRLRELIPDGSGGWQVRPARISLAK